MPETKICPDSGHLAEKVGYGVPNDDGVLTTIYVWECGQDGCEWCEDVEDYGEPQNTPQRPLAGGSMCPVHTGTPEPCPTCGAYIAAGL